jgi:hypothetical protein
MGFLANVRVHKVNARARSTVPQFPRRRNSPNATVEHAIVIAEERHAVNISLGLFSEKSPRLLKVNIPNISRT